MFFQYCAKNFNCQNMYGPIELYIFRHRPTIIGTFLLNLMSWILHTSSETPCKIENRTACLNISENRTVRDVYVLPDLFKPRTGISLMKVLEDGQRPSIFSRDRFDIFLFSIFRRTDCRGYWIQLVYSCTDAFITCT